MTDIASLGIRVTTTGVAQSTTELKALTKEGQVAAIQAEKTGRAWGAALGLAASAIVVGGITAIIKATIESNRVQAQLEARVRSLGSSAAASAKQIDTLATALQGASTFDDEKIKSAATALLTFTNIKPDNFARTLRDITDLAAATGDDLVASAERVGKALNNPLTASRSLREIGIELTAGQKDLIKSLLATGDAAGAQAVVLRELEKRYSGAAEAARNTLGGSLQGLKNDFENLLEGNGSGVNGTIAAINNLGATMRSSGVREGFATIVNGLFSLANVAAKVVTAFAIAGKNIGFTIAEMAHQASIAVTIAKNVQTLGLAEGTISGALKESRAGRENLKAEQAELRAAYDAIGKSAQQAGVNIAGYSKEVRGSGVFANVNTDPQAPTKAPRAPRVHSGGGGGGGGVGAGSSAAADARAALEAQNALAEAQDGYHQQLLDMQADIAGPLAQANRAYEKQMSELDSAFAKGEVTLADYAKTQDVLGKQRDKETAAIKAQLSPFKALLAEKENDLRLMGLQGVARDMELDRQRLGRDLTIEETAALREKNKALEDGAQAADLQREFQDSLSSSIRDFVTGAKSAKDAAKGFFDSIADYITRMIAENWAKKIGEMFAGQGADGQQTGTNWFSTIVGLLGSSGGGRATGGPVSSGSYYQVGENNRPELLEMHGKQWLIPGDNGKVTPMSASNDSQRVVNNHTTFVLPNTYTPQTQAQIAQQTQRVQSKQTSRNR